MMLDFQQKRKLRGVLYNRVTLIILAIFVLISLRSVWVVYGKQRESDELRNNAADRVTALSQREAELQGQLSRLQTEQGIEAEIRSKFSVAKHNENVVVIVDDAASTSTTTPHGGLWQKIIDFFTK